MERVWLARLRLSHIPSEAILDFLADFCLCFLAGGSLVSSWPFGWLFSLSLSLASDGSTLRPFRNFCFNCSFHEPCIHCNKIQCEWQIFKCKKNGRTVVAKPERLGNCTPFSIPITSCVCNTNTYNFVAEFISKNWIFVHQSLTSCPVLGRSWIWSMLKHMHMHGCNDLNSSCLCYLPSANSCHCLTAEAVQQMKGVHPVAWSHWRWTRRHHTRTTSRSLQANQAVWEGKGMDWA